MLRVIALCEVLEKAASLWGELANLSGVQLQVLITDNSRASTWRFLSRLAVQFLRLDREVRRHAWAMIRRRGLVVTRRALHDPKTLAWIRTREIDVGLHAAGVIYRKPLLDAFKMGVLNPHIGILPVYRGRSVMEWSLLHSDPTGITIFFMDEGIDTGSHIVLREEVPVAHLGSVERAKRHLFDLDGRMFARALVALQDPNYRPTTQAVVDGKRFYAMSVLLRGVVDQWLQQHVGAEMETAVGVRSTGPVAR